MAKARKKTAAIVLRVPQSDAEAEQMIAELGASQRDQLDAQTRHDAQVAVLEESHGKVVKGFQEAQARLTEGLSVWATAHRDRLTRGGKTKTATLASGSVLWREGRYAVKHRPLKVEEVVEAIRERIVELEAVRKLAKAAKRHVEAADCWAKIQILEGFLRTKVEPNKDAMLLNREVAETIRGVTVPRGPEEFVVEPLASQISEVA